jgi:hypothetical protein
MLLVTNTGSFRIALGKLMESFILLALLIVSMLPFASVAMVYGGVGVYDIAQTALFLLVTAFAALSVGLFCSSIFKRTVTATVVAYLMVFAIGVATLIPLGYAVNGIYDSMYNNPTALPVNSWQLVEMIPATVWFNPGLGLMALLTGQTGILESTFQSMPGGYGGYSLFQQIGFEQAAQINMAAMAVCGIVLVLVATW